MTQQTPKNCSHVVIAEDDEFLGRLLVRVLEHEGLRVSLVGTGRDLHKVLRSENVNLVLMDLGMPDVDGLSLLRQVRSISSVPVIVITSRRQRDAKIASLDLGADDYLTKPFDPEEMALRVRNLIQRGAGDASDLSPKNSGQRLLFEGWVLDLEAQTLVDANGDDANLTRSELKLLAALASAPNRVLSRNQLLDAISRGADPPIDRIIDVLIGRLRKKLERNPKKPELIKTVIGSGYKFIANVSRE